MGFAIDEDITLETARLGIEMRGFLNTELGKNLLSEIKLHIIRNRNLLEELDTYTEIMIVQSDIKALRTVLNWFGNVVVDGDVAIAGIQEETRPSD